MKKISINPILQSRGVKKLVMMMKLTTLLFLLGLMQVSATVYSQATKFNFRAENRQIVDVLREIEDESNFRFFYIREQVDVERKVSFSASNATVEEVLDQIFEGENIDYKVMEDFLILLSPGNSTIEMESVSGQQRSVSGSVTDESGEPLPGVTVIIKGTTQGTVTNSNGNYSLSNIPENATLQFSFVGMITQEIEVGDQTSIDVTMVVDAIGIEEVVAIGYGTRKKADLTGSVVNVTAEEANTGGSVTTVKQMLQGRVAGLSTQQGSAQPGGSGNTIIRGRNSIYGSTAPLYVVDGFPFVEIGAPGSGLRTSNAGRDPLSFLNPNDIESIAILKDAAATAIYGSKGANGVILITTKRGLRGDLKVNYDGYSGIQTQAKEFEVLTGPEYMEYWNGYAQGPKFTQDQINNAPTTNWIDEVTQTGKIQNHQISLSAAGENLNYYFSTSYYDHTGIVKNAEMDRISSRSNVVYTKGKLKIANNLSWTNIKDRNQSDLGDARSGMIGAAIGFPSYLEPSTDGSYVYDPSNSFNVNPTSFLDIKDEAIANKFNIGINMEYEVLPGLKPRLKVNYDNHVARRSHYIPSYTPKDGGFPNPETGKFHDGEAAVNSTLSENLIYEALIQYNKTFVDKLNVEAIIGYSNEEITYYNNYTRGLGFFSDNFETNLMGAAAEQYTGTGKGEERLISGFGRLDLSWNNKYFLTGTLRRDGSTKFGENNKWGVFPGVSGSWKLNEENFLNDVEAIDLLKLRVGYGVTGNSGFPSFLTQPIYNVTTGVILGDRDITGVMLSTTVANPDLKWEKTAQFNIGVDYSLWKDRLNGSVEFYNKLTSDLILPLPLPFETGGLWTDMVTWRNLGEFKGRGFEFTANVKMIEKTFFQWNTNFNFSWNDSEVKNLNLDGDAAEANLRNMGIIVGEKPHSYYSFVFDKLNEDGTSLLFKDLDNSGAIDLDDRKIVGNPDPDFIIGLGNDITYKNWNLNFFFEGVFGHQLQNWIKARYGSAYLASPANVFRSAIEEENMPKTNFLEAGGDYNNNTRWIEDGDYIRLQNLTLSYNLPTDRWFNSKISNVKLFAQAQNLFTISNYSGLDPESGGSLYPSVQTFTGGINITF